MDTFVQEIRRKILFLSILGHLAMNVKLRNWYIDAEFRGAEVPSFCLKKNRSSHE